MGRRLSRVKKDRMVLQGQWSQLAPKLAKLFASGLNTIKHSMDPLLYPISCSHHALAAGLHAVWAPGVVWWLSEAALPLAVIPAGWLEAAGQNLGPRLAKIIWVVSFLHFCSLPGTIK